MAEKRINDEEREISKEMKNKEENNVSRKRKMAKITAKNNERRKSINGSYNRSNIKIVARKLQHMSQTGGKSYRNNRNRYKISSGKHRQAAPASKPIKRHAFLLKAAWRKRQRRKQRWPLASAARKAYSKTRRSIGVITKRHRSGIKQCHGWRNAEKKMAAAANNNDIWMYKSKQWHGVWKYGWLYGEIMKTGSNENQAKMARRRRRRRSNRQKRKINRNINISGYGMKNKWKSTAENNAAIRKSNGVWSHMVNNNGGKYRRRLKMAKWRNGEENSGIISGEEKWRHQCQHHRRETDVGASKRNNEGEKSIAEEMK